MNMHARSVAAAPARPSGVREQILAAAQDAVLAKGFGATSIEELIAAVGISKSGFFYHFRDKNELAKELLVRYVEDNNAINDRVFAESEAAHDDPLAAFLAALDRFAEIYADLPSGHPGCIVASVCYHERLFSRDVLEINRRAVEGWRDSALQRLERIDARYPLRIDARLEDLADMMYCVADGGIILSRVARDPMALPRQMRAYRALMALAFGAA